MSKKTDYLICLSGIVISLILITIFAVLQKERLLMSSMTLLMGMIGTSVGAMIKYKFPYLKKIVWFYVIVFTVFFFLILGIIMLLGRFDAYSFCIALGASSLISIPASFIYHRISA